MSSIYDNDDNDDDDNLLYSTMSASEGYELIPDVCNCIFG